MNGALGGSLAPRSVACPGLPYRARIPPASFRQVAKWIVGLAGMGPEARRSHLKSETSYNL